MEVCHVVLHRFQLRHLLLSTRVVYDFEFLKMWRHRHPGFALLLLRELQKQQHGSLHCDTLLQAEGVSIPAHSCVLSALSPVFSRVLANSPSLPVGQSRLVKLHAIGANALLKLVGFMYSGEIEGESLGEQKEVFDVAHRLGFSNLLGGKKKHANGHQDKATSWREIGLQTEEEREAPLVLTEGQSFTHAGTQTDSPEGIFTDACCVLESGLSTVRSPALAFMSSEDSTISPLAGVDLLNDTAAASCSSLSEALAPAHLKCCQQMEVNRGKNPKKTDQLSKEGQEQKQIEFLNVKQTGSEPLNPGTLERTKRIGGKDFHKLIEKLGLQNSSAFEQSGETRISLKIKLKRRSREALWEIVSIHNESQADETINQMTSLGLQMDHSPALLCRSLGTVTLTPPSDMNTSSPATPARASSEKPHLPTHDPVLLSSPLQMQPAPEGLPQAEESDEHIVRLLEDMVMMGINILPSESTDGNGIHHLTQLCSHLDPKMDQCEAAPANNDSHNIEASERYTGKMTSVSSRQQAAGSAGPNLECQSRCRTVELKNMASVGSHSASFVESLHVAPQKESHSSSAFLYTVSEKVPAFTLPVCTENVWLPHQNVGELKNVLDNNLWTNNYVQSMKQALCNTSEGRRGDVHISKVTTSGLAQHSLDKVNVVTEAKRDMANSIAMKHATWFKQTAIVEAPNSDNGANFNEMRLPRCLSPLASEKQESGTLNPLEMSSWLSASPVDHQPLLMVSLPLPQTFCGKADQLNPSHTPLYVKQNNCASLSSQGMVLRKRSSKFRPNKDYFEKATNNRLGLVTTQSWCLETRTSPRTVEKSKTDRPTDKASCIKRTCTKRCSVEAMANEQDKKRTKITAFKSNGVDVQMVKPCSVNEGNGASIDTTKQTGKTCTEEMDWLRSGKTIKRVPTNSTSLGDKTPCKTSRPLKCRKQSVSRQGTDLKEPTLVVKRGHGRPRKKADCAAGFVQNLSKVRKLNNLSAGFDDFSSADHYNLQSTQRSKIPESVQNEGHLEKDKKRTVVKRARGKARKKGKHDLGLLQSESKKQAIAGLSEGFAKRHGLPKAKSLVKNECKDSTALEPQLNNVSTGHGEVNTDMNAETTKQAIRHASQNKRPSIVDHIFHQAVYSKGMTEKKCFLPMGLRARSSFQSAENSKTTEIKCCTNLSPPGLTPKNLREFRVRSLAKRSKLVMGIDEQEEKWAAGENTVERRVEEGGKEQTRMVVDGELEDVLYTSKNKKTDLENGTVNSGDSEEMQSSYKCKNGCLIDGNCVTDTGRIQADKKTDVGINSILPYLSSHDIDLNNELGSDFCSVPFINTCNNIRATQSESSKITEHPFRSEDITNNVTIEKSRLGAKNALKAEQISESFWEMQTSGCSESIKAVSDNTGDFEYGAKTSDGDVEVVEETLVTTDGDRADNPEWSDEKTGMDGSHPSATITEGRATAEEDNLKEPQFPEAEIISSDEAVTQTPSRISKEVLPESEETDVINPLGNAMGPSSVPSARVNFESTDNWDCDEDEEVVVDDVWGSPGVLPHLSMRQLLTILDEDAGEDLEEEDEEVDVTGEETD
ncbi:uncharacterized protein LOC143476258 isoform X2 [Brachyhypopomus gauderio]|uniref:uncharacterized protein LOC143476258 isoform X2 n=1 Tax=Brachyhypopomus gauderio TaxID=698409 RepID=UPI004042DC16